MAEDIADETRAFVRSYIRSMLQLETLLLLARDPERKWTAEAVGRDLRSSANASSVQLERLHELGLLAMETEPELRYWFAPRVEAHRAITASLQQLHRERFHAVVDLIYARDPAHVFANAFKLKKRKDDDG